MGMGLIVILSAGLSASISFNIVQFFKLRIKRRRPHSQELQEFLADLKEGGALLQDPKENNYVVRPSTDSEGKLQIQLKRLDPNEFLLVVRSPKQK